MIKEGIRLDYLNKEIMKLKAIYKNMAKRDPNDVRLYGLLEKIKKLGREKENWEGLYRAAGYEPMNTTTTTTTNSNNTTNEVSIDQPPPIQQASQIDHNFVEFIKKLENPNKIGMKNGKWYPHDSPEGGNKTIGYGHKIKNSNELKSYSQGVSDIDITKLLVGDLLLARKVVYDYIQRKYKTRILLSKPQEEMLIEFAFNLGSLDRFPKFVDAVLRKNWEIARKEYKRGYQTPKGERKEMLSRNSAFYDRFLKDKPFAVASLNEDDLKIKGLLSEGEKEKAVEDFISKIIKGTEWEGKVFVAGGYVRDEFMGKDPKDLDLLINAPNGGFEFAKWITKKTKTYKGPEVDPVFPPEPEINWDEKGKPATPEDEKIYNDWLVKIGNIQKLYTNPVIYPRFGTAKFNLRHIKHNGIDLSDMDIECVMPRKEKYKKGSRKPTITGGELKDDVERRDFTVNSLLKDLSTGEILDLTGMGKADIKSGIIKTKLDPDKIFTDDPLRMLRAIRFTVKYNWKLPMFMIRSLKKNAAQLQNISQERIQEELNKMLLTSYPKKAMELLRITDLMKYVIPELIPLIKLQQNKFHKHDAWDHTMDVLSQTQPILIQRLMALFHDIGKFVTKTITDTGIHFYGHEKEGEKIVGQVMKRLKYPNELIDAVKSGVRHHMRLKHGGDEGNVSDKTLRELISKLGENLEDTLNVIHADNVSHSDEASMPNQIYKIKDRLKTLEIRQNTTGKKENLPINGKDLLDMGIPQGKSVGKIKNVIKQAVLKNPNLSKEEAMKIAGRVASTLLRRQGNLND